jgi:hypothetical protein
VASPLSKTGAEDVYHSRLPPLISACLRTICPVNVRFAEDS